jgi:hypothetical protein
VSETPDFERDFSALLTRAREMADTLYASLAVSYPNVFPDSTVIRTIVATAPLYHAALLALAEPDSSLGALALARPILENWLHLHWIAGDEMSDAACRALRLEMGWAHWTHQLVTANGDATQIHELEARIGEVQRMLDERHCSGRRRDFGDINRATKEAAKELGRDWLPTAWQAASQVAHGSGCEWLLHSEGDATAWEHPTEENRAGWLNNLVVLFNNFAQTAFALLRFKPAKGAPRAVFEETERILSHPILVGSRSDGDGRQAGESLPENR